ncbi:MAG TPA: DinB family protein [Terracidiphilus sp.]|nr:DinB family protein [Terracidiphilus sp.]
MDNQAALRHQLIENLKAGNAHTSFPDTVKDFPAELRGKRPKGSPHSPWELLEHMRIAQWDILEFSRDPDHVSPSFPDGYWPAEPEPPDEKAWDRSVNSFCTDLHSFCALIADESTDLYARLPHGSGQTILREALVAADHNSYHLGQLVLLRRLLGAWTVNAGT